MATPNISQTPQSDTLNKNEESKGGIHSIYNKFNIILISSSNEVVPTALGLYVKRYVIVVVLTWSRNIELFLAFTSLVQS
jgi:hypothetical protein